MSRSHFAATRAAEQIIETILHPRAGKSYNAGQPIIMLVAPLSPDYRRGKRGRTGIGDPPAPTWNFRCRGWARNQPPRGANVNESQI